MVAPVSHPRKHDINSIIDHKGNIFDGLIGATPGITSSNPVVTESHLSISDVSCSAFRNALQSIPQNVWTAIQLNDENYDTDNMHDIVVSNTKIIIPALKPGKYLVSGMGTFEGNPNHLRGISIQKNGAPGVGTTLIRRLLNPAGAQPSGAEVSKVVDLNGDDEIEVYVFQSTLNPLDIMPEADLTFLQVVAQRGVS